MMTALETDLFTLTRGKRTVEITLHYGATDDLIHMLKPGTEIKIPERVVKVPGDENVSTEDVFSPPVEAAPKHRKQRAPKSQAPDLAALGALLASFGLGAVKASDLFAAAGVDEKAGKRALAQLVADGRVVQHGKARGTTYSLANGARP